jgi:biopolymer transport protein ExbB
MSSGANVMGNVVGFPALIRLTNNNFKFGQALTYGEDIRFAKSDNTPLSYEIERWDSANQKAEIWVNVDTVYGANNTQYLEMYWGKSDVGSESDAATVFDTGNGFAGVWHMNEYPAGVGSIRDRTKNAYHGTPTGMNASASVDGIVGRCLDFDGTSDYITLPAITTDFTGGFTVCGWMKYRKFNSWSRLIDFGVNGDNNRNIVCSNVYSSDTLHWGIWKDTTTEISLNVPGYIVLDQWVYVTATYDGTAMHVYKNGALVGSINNPGGLLPANRATSYIAKSNWAADALYSGLIDELQVSKTARSADWIMLSSMNQKASDALVVFGQ